ncbi:MAG: lamin tail domain-containing protein [Pontiellaceae bacterium]|nr:lamin tail domain-containing protein [Pontiellaceae bacterium]MBN2786116.1 lamin tail domain-containing protein [Pontiellaceae bacterium]
MSHSVRLLKPLFCTLAVLCPIHAGATVYISEIMADNSGSLMDSDGDESDWIELYNNSGAAVSLNDWYLTDQSTNLTQWAFPNVEISAHSYLIIFASGKDRAVVGSELHTNFKLSADGEYLALVHANGTTLEDAVSFPAMPEDISFGYAFPTSSATSLVLNAGAPCTAHIPTNSTDAAGWPLPVFDDSSWRSGTTGVGYETGSGYASLIGLNVVSMYGNTPSVYIRVPFEVSDASSVNSLLLSMKYDDGFVAYLNGTQVQTANLAESTAWNSTCYDHADNLSALFEEFDLSSYASLLHEGANLLAIHGFNQSASSSDLLFVPRLEVGYAGEMDTSSIGLLSSPTPGAANTGLSYDGFTEAPVCFPEHGFFDAAFQVTISNITAGAEIRYTLDGSEPTSSSPLYTGPLTVSTTTTLRAKAFLDGWKPSFSKTATYLFLDDVAAEPRSQTWINSNPIITGMDSGVLAKNYYDASNQLCSVQDALLAIPTISVVTDDDNLYSEADGIYVNPAQRWERPASVELINPDGSKGFQVNAGLRIRGGWSRHNGYAKHALRLLFKKEYGSGKLRYPLFEDEGVDEFDNVDLRTAMNYNWTLPVDGQERNTFLRDIFSRDSAGAMETSYTRSRYYHLYLNGKYWGLYMTEERPEASYAASYFGGDPADYDVIKTTSWTDPGWYEVEATDGTLDAYNRLWSAAMAGFSDNAAYFAVQGMDENGEPNETKEKLVDVDNLIDYLLLIYYTGASDNNITVFLNALNNLYGIYNRENPDGFKWLQHDCEHSLDTSTQLDRTGPFTDSKFLQANYFNPQTLHEKLLGNAEYRLTFADRVYRHFYNGGALTRAESESRMDRRQAQIDRAIIANAARWGSTSLDRDTWLTAAARARAFFAGRENAVIGYLNADALLPSIDPPQISPAGGTVASGTEVTLSADEGTIYYTTDGSDPRAIGGAVAGSAYTGPIIITAPTKIKSRALSASDEWSALCETVFLTDEVPLAITELMYHAPSNQLDFIEICNISDEPVNLYGYKLDSAVDFKFKNGAVPVLAPGQFLVAIRDIDGFCSAYYTNGVSIAGEYKGDFDNNGEKVELEFWNNDLITFRYSDARNWPQAADGAGHSLVPFDCAIDDEPAGSLNYGGNWRASTCPGGSPGFPDGLPPVAVLLNEITAHTDTGEDPPFESNDQIELYNPTASAITLNGWYLSDDLGEPLKWAIPSGTVIPAHGFVLFDEDDFHPGRVEGFGLDKAGEEVVLSAPDRIVDVIRFKGQLNGASLGRYPDGAPDWLMTLPTPETTNVLFPETVRISGLMYNPPAPAGYASGDLMEYVQIENRSAGTFSFSSTAGAMRVDGGISYTFPDNFSLESGKRLWLVPFDPANTVLLNLFCATYGLNKTQETILGPYDGHLSNEGERVAIEWPQESDDPLYPMDISWVVLDELYYFNQSPWPDEADGTGYALVRSSLTEWGVPTPNDTDADRLDDEWENAFFGNLTETGSDDYDQDGFSNLQEKIAGTNPTNSASYFRIEGIDTPSIHWTAVAGRTYSVYWTDDLQQPFMQVASGITEGSFAGAQNPTNGAGYYFIAVESD